jgi:hypothetical protein
VYPTLQQEGVSGWVFAGHDVTKPASAGTDRSGPVTTTKETTTMPTDFTTFQDNDLVLPKANGDIDQDIAFSTPGVDTTKNGFLAAEVNPTSGTPTLELKINGTSVYTNTFGNNVQRAILENVALSTLQTNNTLTVKVTGNGEIALSDCHLMYKTV